jgi:DNA invertase Pin-like site-specific DNA recombinase
VVGERTRCWFGNQFSLTAPRFEAYGLDVWVPELGGRFDSREASHKMLMSVLGGMSESEQQHVQARVRAAMDAQVVNEGRHQGGRAPYGYTVVDGGAHPNPRKAATPWSTVVRIPIRERRQRAIVFAYWPWTSRQRKSFGESSGSTWTVEATGQSRSA